MANEPNYIRSTPRQKSRICNKTRAIFLILTCAILIIILIYFIGFRHPLQCTPINYHPEELMSLKDKHPHYYRKRDAKSLKLVHVIVRHGDRTNLKECKYPNDPYLNATYAPFGHGQLTNFGKRRLYEVGRALRYQYKDFIGDYEQDELDAMASHLNRAKASLELLLFGLFPPAKEFVWLPGLPWQPVPFQSMMGKDNLLGNPRFYCINWQQYYNESMQKFHKEMTQYQHYFDELTTLTGWTRNLFSVNLFYNSVSQNLEWGFELDDKLKNLWPEPTMTLNRIFWKSWTETDKLKSAGAGMLLEKVINDSKSLETHNKKLFIYSCHDFNIVSLLRILGQEIYDNPAFGAQLIVEVHYGDAGEQYYQFLYREATDKPALILNIPACSKKSKCDMKEFEKIHSKYYLRNNMC